MRRRRVVEVAIVLGILGGATASAAAVAASIPVTAPARLCAAQSGQAFDADSGFYACFVPHTREFTARELRTARVLCERAYGGTFIEPGFTRAYVCTDLGT